MRRDGKVVIGMRLQSRDGFSSRKSMTRTRRELSGSLRHPANTPESPPGTTTHTITLTSQTQLIADFISREMHLRAGSNIGGFLLARSRANPDLPVALSGPSIIFHFLFPIKPSHRGPGRAGCPTDHVPQKWHY